MNPNEVQSILRIEPPYGTRLVQHLHHAELLFANKDAKAVIDWIHNLNLQAVSVLIMQVTDTNVTLCKNCDGGHIVDTTRTNNIFPNGIPMKCPVCNGTSIIIKEDNDIISDTMPPPPVTETSNSPVIHVTKDTE